MLVIGRIHLAANRILKNEMISRLVGKLLKPDADPPREWGRNEPCWCGSGKKYKACHQGEDERKRSTARAAACRLGST